MKKTIAFSLILLLIVALITGCADSNDDSQQTTTQNQQSIISAEQISAKLKNVIEHNKFYNIVAFKDRVLKSYITDIENEQETFEIEMLDIYGNTLATHSLTVDDAYSVQTLTATNDGGFLFVVGFYDHVHSQGVWASDDGFASRVVKCDQDGNVQFDTALDLADGYALRFCFEKNGKFYLFGDIETPETNVTGIGSPTDVYMVILDNSGNVLKTNCTTGKNYDSLDCVEVIDNGFILSISSQSADGDFVGSTSAPYPSDWVFTINDELEITDKKHESGRDYFDKIIGERNGNPIYTSDKLFNGFDAGKLTAFIDYGEFYLIVSERITGEYENMPPVLSSIWYYTETVYSGYDQSGNLIFRDAIDSSPDYDKMAEKFQGILCN